jgi:CubicO group peptidase (beta-lactamase class C family)
MGQLLPHRYLASMRVATACLIAAALATSLSAQTSWGDPAPSVAPADHFRDVRALITWLLHEERIPSIAVAVANDGRILWEEGFGWADRERRIPATPHTPYSIASITKSMTSTAVMSLAERGALDLDAPIDRYMGRLHLTGFAGETRGVTARRVMAHSAGLPTHYYFYHGGYSPPSAEETVARYGIVVFPPGSQFNYSNIGFRTLDLAISNLSKQSYGEFLRKEIFIPLGMTRSAVGVDPAWAGDVAARYDMTGTPIPYYETDTPGSGDVWTSVHDLVRFGMFHAGMSLPDQRPILEPETIRLMQQHASAPPLRWGLGWSLEVHRGHRLVRHGGNQPGVHAQLYLYPDEDIVIAVLSNQNHWKVRDVATEIASVLMPREGWLPTPPDPPAATTALPGAYAGRWIGTVVTYQDSIPFSLTFKPDGDVIAKLDPQSPQLVNGLEISDARVHGWLYGFMPTPAARRHQPHILALSLRREGDELVGQVVAETILDPGYFALPSFVRLRRVSEASGQP